jgi:hypothetical protein
MLLFVAVMRISTYYLFIMLMQPIHIKLTPSKLLLGLISSVSIACCLILMSLPILLAIKCVIIALIIASSVFFILRDVLLRLPSSWEIIDVDNKGALTLTNKSGQQFQLTPAPNSFIHAGCSVLNFERNGFKFASPSVILLANAEHADELRRLRVWLRWFKHQASNQEGLSADLAA